jgi:hypothetical protein
MTGAICTPSVESAALSNEHDDLVLTIAFYCAVVRVLTTMKIDNGPNYKEVLKQYPIRWSEMTCA